MVVLVTFLLPGAPLFLLSYTLIIRLNIKISFIDIYKPEYKYFVDQIYKLAYPYH